jgi:tRNA U55 pseudouridine synthase TruB
VSRFEMLEAHWGGEALPDEPAAVDGRVYDATFLVECSSGTYVRSLARDLARSLGSEAHVRSLRRERIGPFVVADAVPAAQLDDGAALAAALHPLGAALPHLPALTVTPLEAAALRRGEQPGASWLRRLDRPLEAPVGEEVFLQACDAKGSLVAVLRIPVEGGLPRSAAVFPDVGQEESSCT